MTATNRSDALVTLNELSSRLWNMQSLHEGLEEMLGATMALLGAEMGNVQIHDPGRGVLTIAAQCGFDHAFLDFFREVSTADDSACGRALRSRERIVIEDVETDDGFAPLRLVARAAGFRAVQSTPLLGRNGVPLGVLSTHFRTAHRPTEQELRWLDLYVRHAAEYIERCRNEQALRESEARYRSLTSILADVPWTTDAAGHFTQPQEAYSRYTGKSSEDLRGSGWINCVHPDDRTRLMEAWNRAVATKTLYDTPCREWHGSTQQWRHVIARGTPVLNADGSVREWVGALIDVHDQRIADEARRQSEDALREADRRKDEFLAMLAHELRNPLAPIRTGLELIRLAGNNAASVERVRTTMERQIGHMVRLIDDLLDVSRITSGKIQLQCQPTPLTDMVSSAIDANRATLEAAGIRLRVHLPHEPCILDVDATRMVQVLSNLLHNAGKFTRPGGHVHVSARCTTPTTDDACGELELSVADDGIGISPEMLARVFDLFTQGARPIRGRAQPGLGIGLALARRLVEMHGGRIEATSQGLEQGSTFTIYLPLRALDTADSSEPRLAVEPVPRRVVVIDDNEDAARTTAMLIEAFGSETRVAHNGEAGLQAIIDFRPDVVLLDIGMPGMDGYETCRRARDQPFGSDLLIVALTGWGQEEDKRRARAAGFDAHLTKPADPAVLERILAASRQTK